MQLAVYIVLAFLAALVDHAYLSAWWWSPDLSLALAAWAMVDGTEEGVVWRAMLAGLARELVDPAGNGFDLIAFTALGIGFLPLRRFLFRTRGAAWAVWAATAFVLMRLADSASGGFLGLTLRELFVGAATTAAAAIACGWLFGGLPARLRPVGIGGA